MRRIAVARRRSSEPTASPSSAYARVADEAERDEHEAEHDDLRPHGAAVRVDELRQEREEEERRLRVEDVDDGAAHEHVP